MKNVLLILSIIDSRAFIPSYKEKGLAPLPFLFIFLLGNTLKLSVLPSLNYIIPCGDSIMILRNHHFLRVYIRLTFSRYL